MKTIAYDEAAARRLVPLLRSILGEMCEHRQRIARLERRHERLSLLPERGPEFYDVQARLSLHRRELRLTGKELERLGCALDPDDPLRVLIPGPDGDRRRGFSWVADDVPACVADRAAARTF